MRSDHKDTKDTKRGICRRSDTALLDVLIVSLFVFFVTLWFNRLSSYNGKTSA
jgi:hypothetical protein